MELAELVLGSELAQLVLACKQVRRQLELLPLPRAAVRCLRMCAPLAARATIKAAVTEPSLILLRHPPPTTSTRACVRPSIASFSKRLPTRRKSHS